MAVLKDDYGKKKKKTRLINGLILLRILGRLELLLKQLMEHNFKDTTMLTCLTDREIHLNTGQLIKSEDLGDTIVKQKNN